MKQIIITVSVVVAFIVIVFFIGQTQTTVPPVSPELRYTTLYDRNDTLMKEGDRLRTPGAYDSVIRYGEYEGTTQFYIEDEKGSHPLEDWSNQPKETWSEIIK